MNLIKSKNYISELKYFVFSILIGTLINCGASKNDTNSNTDFTPIFNGKDWDGWHLKLKNEDAIKATQVFAIEDGMIHVYKDLPDSLGLDTGENASHGMIYTNKKYSKFIFKFDYKWGSKIYNNFNQFQYDAGMYYHVVNDKIWPVGFEYQVRYNHTQNKNHTGDFWAPPGTKLQWYAGPDGTFELPQNGGKPQPFKKGEQSVLTDAPYNGLNGKWNQCEVIVMGDKYAIHKLNGKIVNMATDLSISEGLIGLQSETAEIFYRNIQIQEFDEFIPLTYFLKN